MPDPTSSRNDCKETTDKKRVGQTVAGWRKKRSANWYMSLAVQSGDEAWQSSQREGIVGQALTLRGLLVGGADVMGE